MQLWHRIRMKPVIRRIGQSTLLLLAAVILAGCFRGQPKEKPPIHPIPDMDNQPKYMPQARSEFFDDNATMRQPVFGTVARGGLQDDPALYTGKDENGNLVTRNPLNVDMQLLEQGQKQYDIYCTPCHSHTGDGRGIIVQYNYPPAGNFHDQRLREATDGHFFDVITNGLRNMPSYDDQVAVRDRWAIVAYIRALQKSQNARLSEIHAEKRDQLRQR